MRSKFRKKKGKPQVRRWGFEFFHDWIDKWAYRGRLTNQSINRRIKDEKLAAKPPMKAAANAKRARRRLRNLDLLAFSPNYGKHRHA